MKPDRHLYDGKCPPDGAISELDLERVAPRPHGMQIEGLECRAAKALEATRQVAHINSQQRSGIPTPGSTDYSANGMPFRGHRPARHVARSQDHIGALAR